MSAKVSSYLGTYEGDIIIQVWGVVTVSDNSPPMTPKGRLDSMTDDTYPVSKHRAYSAVLYKGDDVLFVGDSNDFYVAPITNLFLGLNESHHADDIAFRDNKGFWNWKVCARDGKAKLYPFKESRVP